MTRDEFFLSRAVTLAKKGLGWTNPNPMVGAVIVQNGKILAQGYHQKAGLPHAEINALTTFKGSTLKGATLYVNLEPCVHHGRTAPCVDAIIKSGIKKVVCATTDSNPQVHGQGIAYLRHNGINVSVGLLEEEARILNEAFFTYHEKKRPFIALKFAASLDGKIATRTGDSKWITGDKARSFARKLRGQYQAVLVGINTVISDDPHLGARKKNLKDPLRIILDTTLKIPLNAQVLRDKNVLIATTAKASKNKKNKLQKLGYPILSFGGNNIPPSKLLEELKQREIISILVEGGGEVLGSFIDEKLADKVYAFYAQILIGGEKAKTIGGVGVMKIKDSIRLKNISFKSFGDDFLISGYL